MIFGLCLSLALTTIPDADAAAAEVSVSERGHASNPTWSADGSYLAFEVNDYNGTVSLYVVKISNGTPVGSPSKAAIPGQSSSFASKGSMAANAVWHPDGMAIFEGAAPGADSRLYFLSPGGAAPSQLLTAGQVNGDLSWPAISTDGMKVAFVSDITGDGDIYIWDRQSNAVTAVVQSPYSEMAPAFHSDGTLVYTRKNQGGQDLFLLKDGSFVPLVGGNGDQTRPAWAGSKVVFFSNERGDDSWDIVSSSGPGQKKTIARNVRLPVRAAPAVSDDGRWIAYGSSEPDASHSVYFVSADGAYAKTLKTSMTAVGEPSLIQAGGRTYVAYTALPSAGADWRQLRIEDVTSLLQ